MTCKPPPRPSPPPQATPGVPQGHSRAGAGSWGAGWGAPFHHAQKSIRSHHGWGAVLRPCCLSTQTKYAVLCFWAQLSDWRAQNWEIPSRHELPHFLTDLVGLTVGQGAQGRTRGVREVRVRARVRVRGWVRVRVRGAGRCGGWAARLGA